MKIGIHKGKDSYGERWVAYCEENGIDYKLVNCYDSDIVAQLADCDALMWHHHHIGARDVKFAKQLLFALENAGKKVFPNFRTEWHFDDKVGQKYLFEALGSPFVPAYVFYTKAEALAWASSTSYPKVFKLRGGAGSANVKLAGSFSEAKALIRRSFGRGFKQYNALDNLKERYRRYRLGKATLFDVFKGILRIFHTTDFGRLVGNEKGYAYFQDFIPNNTFDIRIVIIDDKAFGLKRLTRDGDFRASGSGFLIYAREELDERCLPIAFETAEKMGSQCAAFDFVFDPDNTPLIVEVSYGFLPSGYDRCEGYWDRDFNWHAGAIDPYGWMVEQLIRS